MNYTVIGNSAPNQITLQHFKNYGFSSTSDFHQYFYQRNIMVCFQDFHNVIHQSIHRYSMPKSLKTLRAFAGKPKKRIKATPHKDRASRFVRHLLASFPSFLPKTPRNTPVLLRRFGQSYEKSAGATAAQSLCGVALNLYRA